ncbi:MULTISPECIES: LysR family transcriptional regulator [unclassified Mesorhizobium]|uniref:LysR family transcriptional regulator n=1 Tax=unclassified Mesorhizobium TaxID=325217 RepID=UPI000FD974A5|nr:MULTISPECIES: LysR family transcriptional regulator [unclassified Mesorhizobium]TGT73714.1 LysR family transcriptional regulator [Mesorhizobium sp. M2E.F.Ca.ET.166.01.1.1]TGW00229.1 LysR family transcriptional regulator [Mesorhizobium sp. M2E.F.Ca.ET.154.01.1.1]
MEMHQVRYFLMAANSLSFTRAAEACHVSQPALTTAIKKLEAQLGTPLFYREGKQIVLTEFGRRMQPCLGQILEQAKAAESIAKDFRLLNQVPIRLGVMSSIGPMRIASLLAAFQRQSPGVEVAVRDGAPEALAAQLDADDIDVAVLNALDGLGDNYRAEPLYTERYVVLLPPEHPLIARNIIALRDLSEQPYVDRLSCELREIVMGVCSDMGVKLYARFRSERDEWVQAMVMANIGFAFMPEFSVTHPESVRRPLVDPAVERTISLITVSGRRHSPAVAAFVRTIRSHRWN